MANKIQRNLIGILMFIFGVVTTYLIWDMIYGFYNMIDSTLLRVFWLGGLITIWTINVIVVPYLMISGNDGIKIINVMKGLLAFIIGSFCCYLSYYIIPPIISVLGGITEYGDLSIIGSIFWFVLVLIWAIVLIVYPLILVLKGGIKTEETNE